MRYQRAWWPTLVNLVPAAAAAVLLLPLLAPSVGSWRLEPTASAAAEATEDVLHMVDGRELHGHILEEKGDAIVFQLIHRKSNIKTRLTFLKNEIHSIDRDVPLADAPEKEPRRNKRSRRPATSQPDDSEDDARTYGSHRASVDDENVTSFYIVPMKGQMGTDIHTDVYREMIDDIREQDPDILVIAMECRDSEDKLYSAIGREEQGQVDFDMFRDMVNLFRDELRDIRQVMWVKDSQGVSTAVALVWSELYMTPEARLAGLEIARKQTGFDSWADDDVRGKMTAAFMSWVKGFLEYGGYSLELADAMVRPEFKLSGTWKGRDVIWSLDTDGDYVVDNSDEATADFRAKTAENLCISDGTAENLDDLALLLGIREYRKLDSEAEKIFEDHKEDWRRMSDKCETWLKDVQQFKQWANGEDTLKYIGQARDRLERVVAAMNRYPAVEFRLGLYGIRKFDLETEIEVMKEQLRAMKKGGRSRGGQLGGRGR